MGSALITINDNAFFGCSSLEGILTIRQGIKTIGSGAFKGCRSLQTVIIPYTVTSIADQAFNTCSNLKTVTINDGVEKLQFSGGSHFTNCPIETLYLGRNLQTAISGLTINVAPFRENSELKSVTVGNDVTDINNNSFYNCTGLSQITSNPSTPPATQSNTFTGVTKTIPVRVPSGAISSYGDF